MNIPRVNSWLHPSRLARWGLAVAIGVAIGFILFVATANGVEGLAGGRLGGDWAPFRTAGVLAARDVQLVLDASAQQAEMSEYLRGAFAPFPYPPILAYLFVPAGWVSFTAGYVIYVGLLVGAAVIAIRWTLDLLGVGSREWRRVGVLGSLTYAGVFRSYAGAQNATITLLVLVGGLRLLDKGRPVRAGLVLGLLWFKPQFAVPALGLVLASGYVRTALWGAVPGIALYLGNVAVFGARWVTTWVDEILSVTDRGNRIFNTQLSVSPVEFLRGRVAEPGGDMLAIGLALLLGVLFIALARRCRDPAQLLPLLCSSLLLTAVHALPYELTLLVPVIGAALVARGVGALPVALGVHLGALVILFEVHPLVRVAYVFAVTLWWMDGQRHLLSSVGQARGRTVAA